jgi:hypothetical protein
MDVSSLIRVVIGVPSPRRATDNFFCLFLVTSN